MMWPPEETHEGLGAFDVGLVTHPCDECAIVALQGDLDLRTSPALKLLAAGELARGRRCMVFVMDELSFFDCSAVSVLMSIHASIRGRGIMAVVCSRPSLRRILAVTGVDRSIPVVGTMREASMMLQGREGCHLPTKIVSATACTAP